MSVEADPKALENQLHTLRKTLGKMEVALDAVTDAIVWTDERGRIQWCNALFEKLVQKQQLMLLSKNLIDVLPLSQSNQVLSSTEHPGNLALSQQCQGTNFYDFCQENILRILEISWASIQFEDAQSTSAVLAIRDVTERKKAEAELEKYREKLESLVEQRTLELSNVNEHLQAELLERQRVEKLLVKSEAAIRALYEVTASPKLDFDQAIEELLNFGCEQFNLPIGVLSRIQDKQYEVCLARLPTRKSVQRVLLNLENTYCQDVIASNKTLCILAAGDTSWANSACYQSLKLEAYFGTPVSVDGQIYGTLNFSSQIKREEAFSALDKELLLLMAQWVGREIERQQAAITLAKARDDALAATKTKSEFLATMSHEIRTPMNAVIGMTSLLLDTALTDEQRNFVTTVRNSGNALLSLINDILDFSKIESGHLELEAYPFNLRACIEEAFDLISARAAEKQLELAFHIDSAVHNTFMGDVTRLRQILVNLLGNAVKFTHQGEISISVTHWKSSSLAEPGSQSLAETHQSLCFAVKDTGIGIPAQRIERLFKAFSQVDSSTTRKYGGTGLGLAICKQLVEMMGGNIWVDSQVDQGSTFFFTVTVQTVLEKRSHRSITVPAQLVGKRLLIVDDNATNRQILEKQTQTWGMLTRTTASGSETLKCFERGEVFDLAILDMQMPEMDGMTLAQEIHALPAQKALPLMMLTSVGKYQISQADIERHFVAFLNKPIKQAQLLENLVRLCEGESIKFEQPKKLVTTIDHHLAEKYPLQILLAEDNGVNQQLATQLLKKMGYRADVVGNGLEVINALERQSYDVILMDLQMPEMDGLIATQKICERWPAPVRPWIVAVTANAMQGDREACLKAGMDNYISKPIQIEELVTALQQVPSRSSRENFQRQSAIQADAKVQEHEDVQLLAQELTEASSVKDGRQIDKEVRAIESAIDHHQLCNLVSMMGGEVAVLKQLVDTYISESPDLIQRMDKAVIQNDALALEHNAHTLKSSSHALGALELSNLCARLEKIGRENQMDDATKLLEDLHDEYRTIKIVLTTDVNKLILCCNFN
ncbi:multi-sensor hybrid histidine kinase [Leptolyngbya sp. Heron Island J]|uniref:response regulator n=1 Tax=Leptolyngbya sp. Heron Island J TaxID=1385935 RepID=UPI0003B944F0|nr:response regulator [Leptolyngbya sp. Heron Island J]ESA38992.1 multi-sensor hybrid histidine kinase [Leptolyngbya sp. Heron Island J]